jgi:hypothetical protein
MDLNSMGSGKKLIEQLVKNGNVRRMGWTRQQQQEAINKQKNSRPANPRNK